MKKPIKFDMHLRVPHDRISTIIDALTGACEVVKIEQAADEKLPAQKRIHYKDGKRGKGISGRELFLQTIADGSKTMDQITAAFVRHGFSDNSPSPIMSTLRKAGQIHFEPGTRKVSKIK
jgi:hypothetical protein